MALARSSTFLVALLLMACSAGTITEAANGSDQHLHTAVAPATTALCSESVHAQYTTLGPDGRQYATWHPPTDPATGCTFGHEHGRDPRGSKLYTTSGDIPFGYANAQLAIYDPALTRVEDHVGHKIEWENDVPLQRTLNGRRVNIGVKCSFMTKLHQGTHSHDAFTNNLHELVYLTRCSDGTELRATIVAQIGQPGEFVRSCDKNTVVRAGSPVPAASPRGAGVRFIPDATCTDRFVLVANGNWSQYSQGLYEDWITSNYLRTASGQQLAYFDPHFAVFSPSRYYQPGSLNALAHTMDLCYVLTADGRKARGGECDWATNYGNLTGITYDDPRSAFKGTQRETYFNQTTLQNKGGPTVWYTDPLGGHAGTQPFPGSIRQYVSAVDNRRSYPLESQAFGKTRAYGGPGTRAPN